MKKIGKLLVLSCALIFAASKTTAQVSIGVGISVRIAPPELPVYVQPPCPVEGYLWQPGFWAYDNDEGDYYWVPGVWVAAPQPGYLWTPAYWGYEGGVYAFHAGYWGPHVGFYGGINYGYGYGGYGFGGGRWEGDHFRYNTAVVNVNTTVVHNTYIDRTVVRNTYVNNHVSYNGGGGVNARPRPEEEQAMREQHIQPTAEQISHRDAARQDKSQFAKVNNGHPTAAAMDKPGGRPIDEHGQVAVNSKLGNRNADKNGVTNPANGQKPANNAAPGLQRSPQQQTLQGKQANPGQQQRNLQPQPGRQANQTPQQRQQQRAQQLHRQQQRRMQQQKQQRQKQKDSPPKDKQPVQ
jgi:hypothetical protein